MSNIVGTNLMFGNIDLSRVGVCDKGCNIPATYYCFKGCVPNVTYYCYECSVGDEHDHRSISRDKECNKLHELFMKVFN